MVFGGTESTNLNLLSWLCLIFKITAFGLKKTKNRKLKEPNTVDN